MHQLISCTTVGISQSVKYEPVGFSSPWVTREHSTVGYFITIEMQPSHCDVQGICHDTGQRAGFAFALL